MNNKSAAFAFRSRERAGTEEDLRCKYRAKIRNLKIAKQTTGFYTKKISFSSYSVKCGPVRALYRSKDSTMSFNPIMMTTSHFMPHSEFYHPKQRR